MSQLLTVAPLFTSVVASFSVILVIISLRMQRSFFKKKNTFDFLVKTELDEKLMRLKEEFRVAVEVTAGRDDIMTNEDFKVHRYKIIDQMSIHELSCIGMKAGALDESILKLYAVDLMRIHFQQAYPLISQLRSHYNDDEYYDKIEFYIRRWHGDAAIKSLNS